MWTVALSREVILLLDSFYLWEAERYYCPRGTMILTPEIR